MPSDKLTRIAPEVRTLARPSPGPLISARHNIQRSPEAQALFQQAREEKWPAERLAEKLTPVLQGRVESQVPGDIEQAAHYLADEYLQIGDALLLISTETGQALAKITEDDIWVPPPVPRQDGSMAQPLPRLRPELEGFLVEWVFNTGREAALTAALARRLPQSDLQRAEGDRRLLPVTRNGRKHIVEQIREALPTLIPDQCQGLTRQFFDHFEFRENDPEGLNPLLRCTALARSVVPIADPKGFNLRHDHFTSVAARISSQWAREIARTLSIAVHRHYDPPPVSYKALGRSLDIVGSLIHPAVSLDFWVADANTVEAFYKAKPGITAFPVEGALPTGLSGRVGAIVINKASYTCGGREYVDRWEVAATVEYTLWLDWEMLRALAVEDVPVSGLSVEVLDRTR